MTKREEITKALNTFDRDAKIQYSIFYHAQTDIFKKSVNKFLNICKTNKKLSEDKVKKLLREKDPEREYRATYQSMRNINMLIEEGKDVWEE